MNNPLLKAENISYCYQQTQWHLDNVSYQLSKGEMLGIIGPNGSGKSTLLKISAGILTPKSGNIFLTQTQLQKLNNLEKAKILAYLPQYIFPAFNYTVEDVVAMGRYPHQKGLGFLDKNDYHIISECMELTEIANYRKRKMSNLSGGERQRVLLASVLAQQPKVLMLDEPTSGLDIHHQVEFFSLLKKLSTDNIAIAIVTHNLNLAGMFCDQLLLLNKGKTVMLGSSEQVIRSDNLLEIYKNNIMISNHPVYNVPTVLPISSYFSKGPSND